MYAPALLIALAASGAAAFPALHIRQDPCAGISGSSFSSLSNFTLAVLNSTVTDKVAVGPQLVVGQNGSSNSGVLSTYSSYHDTQYASFTLKDGVLIPVPDYVEPAAPGTDSDVASGDMPGFVFSNSSLPSPAAIYCGIGDSDSTKGLPDPLLAVHGDAGSFSLCQSGSGATALNSIVYKAAASSQLYDHASCYSVKVQMIGMGWRGGV
ncbi:hypothetical protein B0H21DRAFT_709076 [Amylocystis lapponica]|nr:hypothetical protein B0H21DRAFT_709076 [Amylocystis lapponica]